MKKWMLITALLMLLACKSETQTEDARPGSDAASQTQQAGEPAASASAADAVDPAVVAQALKASVKDVRRSLEMAANDNNFDFSAVTVEKLLAARQVGSSYTPLTNPVTKASWTSPQDPATGILVNALVPSSCQPGVVYYIAHTKSEYTVAACAADGKPLNDNGKDFTLHHEPS